MTSGDARKRTVIRRIFGIRGKNRIFCRRYIVGTLTNKANISIEYYIVPIKYRLSTDSKTRDLEWPSKLTIND